MKPVLFGWTTVFLPSIVMIIGVWGVSKSQGSPGTAVYRHSTLPLSVLTATMPAAPTLSILPPPRFLGFHSYALAVPVKYVFSSGSQDPVIQGPAPPCSWLPGGQVSYPGSSAAGIMLAFHLILPFSGFTPSTYPGSPPKSVPFMGTMIVPGIASGPTVVA